nr:UvrD-helicase domain-containing protein [Kofleriaceae bacterium]
MTDLGRTPIAVDEPAVANAPAPVGTVVRVARPEQLPPASDRFVVVDASAGTGKTYFLEHRVVDLVLGAGADLSQILVVTFTEKAVAELRMRIRDLLDRLARAHVDTAAPGAPAWELDDVARARLRAAVTAFDRAPIFTIHGFCHRVLVEDAFAARRLFDQTQVPIEVAFDTAFSTVLRERFAVVEPDRGLLAAYLSRDTQTVDTLRDLLLACARTGATPRPFAAEAIAALEEPLVAAFGSPAGRAALEATMPWDSRQRFRVGGWLDIVGEAFARPLGSPARVLAALDASRDKLELLRKNLKLAAAPPVRAVGAALGAPEALRALLDAALDAMPLGEAVAATLLPSVQARVARDKAVLGLFDYDDMLDLVRDTLVGERGPEVAGRLRTRTPWVMIDEFQDTDPRQWDIFRTVWMDAEARGLAIVGDPKQAIYGFRGADVRTYVAARAELQRAGASEVALTVNRRSTPQLVEAVNAILAGPPLSPMMQGDIAYDPPVIACGDIVAADPRAVTVFALRPTGSGDTSSEAQRLALADAIGRAIEDLRRAPPAWHGRSGARAPFSLAQVMVLTERNAESADISASLRRRGLPCALVESDELFETREAAELADVLDAIAAPRDRSARLRALRTRFFHVAWPDLARVVDAPDHHPAIAQLHDWAAHASRRAYETLFRRVVEDSRFAERALVGAGGERAVTNTWHLVELLLLEVARARSDVHELAAQLRRWIADGRERTDDLDVQRAETDADAIRVLTVHKAKGLEAPYVFFYGGIHRAPTPTAQALRDATGRRLYVQPRDAARALLLAQREGENERLAYVALTRAQVRMFLPYYAEVKDTAMYQCIQRCVAPMVNARGPDVRASFEIVTVDIGGGPVGPADGDALAEFEAAMPPSVAELAPIDGARAGLAVLSYTRLAHDLERARARGGVELAIEPEDFDRDADDAGEIVRATVAADELPPGIASGLFLHEVLELADIAVARGSGDAAAWLAHRDVADAMAASARKHGVDRRFLAHAARVAHRTLTEPLALVDGGALPSLANADALAREVEFTFPVDARGARPDAVVKGFIDALVRWGDELWVVDYKSDVLAGADRAAAATARVHDHYGVQLRLYGLAAQRLAAATGRQLAGLAFAFVRDHVTVPVRVDAAQLAEWAGWLGGLAP